MANECKAPEFPTSSLTDERCRELSGPEARDLSDEEIDAMRRHAAAMADLLIDIFLTQRVTQR